MRPVISRCSRISHFRSSVKGASSKTARVMDAADALGAAGIEPLELSFKEGLALVNGTEAMLALGHPHLFALPSPWRSSPTSPAP